MPTTVLHVTEALGGGVQSAIYNYLRATPELQHTVLSRSRAGQPTHQWPAGVESIGFEGGLTGFFRMIRERVERERPDVIHLHSSFAGAARAFLPRDAAIVYSPHCFAFERADVPAPMRWGYAALEYGLARRPQTTLSVSPYEGEQSRRLNPHNPVVVALNPSPLAGMPEDAGHLPPFRNTVTMVGRVGAQKAPELFAEVAERCRDAELEFSWIGAGGEQESNRLRDAGVSVSGWRTPSEVRELLSNSKLYLHTAAWEGGPVSAIEAASLGVPVLSRSIPSMRSLGYATGGATAAELADSVHRFLGDSRFRQHVETRTHRVHRRATAEQLSAQLRTAYRMAQHAS